MTGLLGRYIHWLHGCWPAGTVERLPLVNADGSTKTPGLYVAGDITGIPLLKFAADTGAKAVRAIVEDPAFTKRDRNSSEIHDLAIIGAGVAGMAAALEARRNNLDFVIIEASMPFNTVVNFPKAKPIFTYPTGMTPAGDLQFSEKSVVREGLLDELTTQTLEQGIEPIHAQVDHVRRVGGHLEVVIADRENIKAHRVIVAIGRSGNHRMLDVPGEELDKVSNRLHDPSDYCRKNVLVVGGGDSALEAAIALEQAGAIVTLSYRNGEFSRPKPENTERISALADAEGSDSEHAATVAGDYMGERRHPGSVRLMMSSSVDSIREDEVTITNEHGEDETIPNDNLFTMIGREAPLDFFRRSGVPIRGEWRPWTYISCAAFVLFCIFLYHWKGDYGIPIKAWFKDNHWFPFNILDPQNPTNLLGTIKISMQSPSFYYSLVYCLCIIIFGVQRIRRRRTPYVKVQTITLTLIQCIPLFLLPYILLPWMGHNGCFDSGLGKSLADALFPLTDWDAQGREYWRSVGFILAWPLMFWNVFTYEPIWAWLIIGFLQTFVIIPLLVRRWGKGAYCGWICSCGALAETMGDSHRHKMPHGPVWNRVNMIGQVLLALALALLVLRIVSWITPGRDWVDAAYYMMLEGKRADGSQIGGIMRFVNYAWFDDLLWAGILGVAFYFWFSGRVWCRFACPLAALMHIYARFSTFRIIPAKKKCISCNICTSVCHQGIDIMNFANKGLPMEDPQCVRCSACVQSCPTGVLQFGRVNRKTGEVIGVDRLPASPVIMAELTVEGRARST